MSPVSRRAFLKLSGVAFAAAAVGGCSPTLSNLSVIPGIANPLDTYPDRDWEKVYRDQYRFDSSFTFVCAPNDTHNCRLRAYVRNGVIMRVEQNYDSAAITDLYGNATHANWNPRGCLKGFTLTRRVYGPYRVKSPMVRKGWKEWVEAGFPSGADGLPAPAYFKRGEDSWLKLSWDEAATLAAKGIMHIAEKYSGEAGAQKLAKQGYEPEMIEALHGAGTRAMKFRAGMWLQGLTRIGALYRFSNMLALMDDRVRKVGPQDAWGGRGWTNFDWHGDLPPGHPMVTGIQCFDPDLNDFRNARLLVFVGKNMVENKMADAHWWVEAIERGAKVVNISPEYSPASQKSDYWIPIRPGSDTALMLAVTNILIQEKKYDADFVKRFTDFPLLVRLDTRTMLRAKDVFPGYQNAKLTGYSATVQQIAPELREKWGDFVLWDVQAGGPKAINRDEVGDFFTARKLDPALEGTFTVTLADGGKVQAKTVFQLYKELCTEYDLDTAADICQSPKDLIRQLADDIATIKPVMIHTGEGVNHYFHCDLTTRAVFLPLALTGNIGKPGANTGHWAGNYKTAVFPGVGVYIYEDPFNIQKDPAGEVPIHNYMKPENVCYWNYSDRPLVLNTPKRGRKVFTGKTHMPTPTKVIWAANVNLLNNAKWAYNMIANTDPRIEMICYNEWEWTGSCEYADMVFPVHSWVEMTQPDFTGSCSNPFLQVWKGGIKPLYDTKMDGEVMAAVANKMADLTGDERFRDYFKFHNEQNMLVYIQRCFDASVTTAGYNASEVLKQERGALLHFRTYPRIPAWEQINESAPFYTRSGRMEFYREEPEFLEYGENLIVHREPVEATPYLPNVIVATHPILQPDDYGIPLDAMSAEEREVRNVKMPWAEVKKTVNPLWAQGYRFYCMTPKTRHRVHSSWSTSDWNMIWDSNFGDPYRPDKRMPDVGEHQMHINPEDAQALGIKDGDYVYVDANPADRPYIGWKKEDYFYKVSRLMLRARFNPSYPRGVIMIKHSPFMASHKSVRAHETRADGLARAEDTGYQANVRYGSQQSLTRGWLQPSQMTDNLARKEIYGQKLGEGYAPDIHSPNTCPKETLVRIVKAEDGGLGGKGLWLPATTGLTPGNENTDMLTYLAGGFISLPQV